jgi:excisionase family DNA binding protein
LNDRTFSEEEGWLSPQDVARRLKVSVRLIYNLIHDKKLGAVRIGGLWRIPESELQSLREGWGHGKDR